MKLTFKRTVTRSRYHQNHNCPQGIFLLFGCIKNMSQVKDHKIAFLIIELRFFPSNYYIYILINMKYFCVERIVE